MSSLSTVEARLPPGFRFHPRDEELICDYLMKWVTGCAHHTPFLIEVDLNKCEPWDIPESACVGGKDWYFYSLRDRKYATGIRTNRATISGYWKATGKDRPIFRNGTLVGMRKTLVFYQGRAPKGRKTDWVMHEFRLEGTLGSGQKIAASVKEDWVLCKVFYKSRSEVAGKQETGSGYEDTSSSASIPELMEPYITFDQTQASAINTDQYHEQVSCFSIFTPNQTSPTFSLVPNIDPGPRNIIPNIGGMLPHLGNYPSSNSDKNVIKAVLNHLTKMESGAINGNTGMKGSPSFGEGSPDSYLSEVGLSYMWNHYS
ncbi:hypothetical protein Pfo_023011 [Paulownia fortunei]|nr:hypothetical protein Pfo_023011 [Paulownia fortunei]